MNRYNWYYRGKQGEVSASTQLEARDKAAKSLKAKKPWEVTVVLVETVVKTVEHSHGTTTTTVIMSPVIHSTSEF